MKSARVFPEVRQGLGDFSAGCYVSCRRATGTRVAGSSHSTHRASAAEGGVRDGPLRLGRSEGPGTVRLSLLGGAAEQRDFQVLPGPPLSGPWGPEHASQLLWEAALTCLYSLTEVPTAVKLRSHS